MRCTNCGAPTGRDNPHVQEVAESPVNDPPTNVVDIDINIARLQLSIDRLLHEQQTLRKAKNALISPILQFPPEITSEIFIQCLEVSYHADHFQGPCLDNAPLLLGRICSQWREAAWSTPRLWKSLSIWLSPSGLDKDAWLIRTWLARSGECPLWLYLRCRDLSWQQIWRGNPASMIIDAIIPYAHRWKEINFLLPVQAFISLGAVKSQLPLLETLKVGLTTDFEDGMLKNPVDVFRFAPRLRDVEISIFPPLLLPLPWGKLSRLQTEHIFVAECLEALRQSPNVVECNLKSLEGVTSDRLPTVRSLHLSALKVAGHTTDMGRLLDCLSLPAIQAIEIRGYEEPWHHLRFISFLTRSSCSLQRLHINRVDVSSEELVECLRHAPLLVELKMESDMDVDIFLLGLTSPATGIGQSPAPAPSLQDISLTGLLNFSFCTLASTLSSRWRVDEGVEKGDGAKYPVARIQSFKIITHADSPPEDGEALSRLRSMIAEGMELRIYTTSFNLS